MKEKLKEKLKTSGSLKGFVVKHRNEIESHELYFKFKRNFQLWAWHIINDVDEPKVCEVCQEKTTSFRGFKNGYNKYCADCGPLAGSQKSASKKFKPILTLSDVCENCKTEFNFKTKNEKKKRKFCSKSCSTEFAHRNRSIEEKDKIDNKRKATNLEKYGDEYVVNSEHTKEKCFNKSGFRYPFQSIMVQEKSRQSLFLKTGYNIPLKNPATVEKMIATKIKRYGDLLKPCYHSKDYTFPSGKTVKVQGYENLALDELLQKYKEKDIFVGRKTIQDEIGEFTFLGEDSKIHRYYPDIYIKSIHTIIEVKSNYTYNLHKNKLKHIKDQADSLGLGFAVMVMNK